MFSKLPGLETSSYSSRCLFHKRKIFCFCCWRGTWSWCWGCWWPVLPGGPRLMVVVVGRRIEGGEEENYHPQITSHHITSLHRKYFTISTIYLRLHSSDQEIVLNYSVLKGDKVNIVHGEYLNWIPFCSLDLRFLN